MSALDSNDERARIEAAPILPFFLTAPISVAVAGGALLNLGEAPLQNNWSPQTMGLTHVITLGFLTLVLLGAFYVVVPTHLNKRIKAPRLPFLVYGTFAAGVVSLCLGLASVAVTPVFIAIGTLFPALLAFFWPAIAVLRGTRRTPDAIPLRVAIGAFVAAATIGIWVAHGHGAMKFPGPRGLWLQIHLSIALFGWIGGMTTAAFNASIDAATPQGARSSTRSDDLERTTRWWGRLTTTGVIAGCLILTLQYFEIATPSLSSASWVGGLAVLPAAVASCWLQPVVGLRRLREAQVTAEEARFWRTAFVLGPVTSILGIAALLFPEPHWRIAFGWVAVWGWAGLMVHAVLRDCARRLFGLGSAREHDAPSANGTLAFCLHLLSLGLGLIAIETLSGPAARLTGLSLLVLAVVQVVALVTTSRSGRRIVASPDDR